MALRGWRGGAGGAGGRSAAPADSTGGLSPILDSRASRASADRASAPAAPRKASPPRPSLLVGDGSAAACLAALEVLRDEAEREREGGGQGAGAAWPGSSASPGSWSFSSLQSVARRCRSLRETATSAGLRGSAASREILARSLVACLDAGDLGEAWKSAKGLVEDLNAWIVDAERPRSNNLDGLEGQGGVFPSGQEEHGEVPPGGSKGEGETSSVPPDPVAFLAAHVRGMQLLLALAASPAEVGELLRDAWADPGMLAGRPAGEEGLGGVRGRRKESPSSAPPEAEALEGNGLGRKACDADAAAPEACSAAPVAPEASAAASAAAGACPPAAASAKASAALLPALGALRALRDGNWPRLWRLLGGRGVAAADVSAAVAATVEANASVAAAAASAATAPAAHLLALRGWSLLFPRAAPRLPALGDCVLPETADALRLAALASLSGALRSADRALLRRALGDGRAPGEGFAQLLERARDAGSRGCATALRAAGAGAGGEGGGGKGGNDEGGLAVDLGIPLEVVFK